VICWQVRWRGKTVLTQGIAAGPRRRDASTPVPTLPSSRSTRGGRALHHFDFIG